ncbi:MAG: hypothetical protein JWM56_1188 [Candidatus Peribacteria bacterium]|nr:hypothetical protein [Candidatus Peribacteria bacterium]
MSPSLVASSEDTRIYEFAIMYPADLLQKQEAEFIKEVEGYFSEAGAMQIAKDAWGRRGLAYPVKGHMEANFVIYYYELDPSKVKEIEQNLRISRNVLRHLVVKPPKNYQILKYSDVYADWQKNHESVDEVRTREKEEKVKEQVAKKAKRQVEKAASERTKETKEDKGVVVEAQLSRKLEELISDDSLDI